MHPQLIAITTKFKEHANAADAVSAKAYLLNQFEFFGLKTPLRRTLSRENFKSHSIKNLKALEAIVEEAFMLPQREYQYFAVELFAFHKKLWEPSSIKLINFCLTNKSWWDSVDHIASDWLHDYFKLFPEQVLPVTAAWNKSSNMWLQRSSIMFQKFKKKETDTALLSKYILNCKTSNEFFIRKAIGWALREYSKTNPQWVINFVKNNQLHTLSEREALKRINKK